MPQTGIRTGVFHGGLYDAAGGGEPVIRSHGFSGSRETGLAGYVIRSGGQPYQASGRICTGIPGRWRTECLGALFYKTAAGRGCIPSVGRRAGTKEAGS